MRSILSMAKVAFCLLALTCFACGGGGGGGGTTTLAELTSEIPLPDTATLAGASGDAHAIVILQVRSDGTINWSAAVPPDVVPDITGLTINDASDATVLVDLLGTETFDPVTGTASGSATVTTSEASALADAPEDYVATLLTSTGPPAAGAFEVFVPAEWHAVLLGSNESTPQDGQGAATLRITSPTTISWVIAMVEPVQADVLLAHIHVGNQGTDGVILVDLNVTGATRDAAAGTITGTVTVTGEQLAQIATNLSGFYVNVHTAAAPNGVARGQLDEGTVEMMAALLGSAETPVVEDQARGGATIEFETFTSGRVITAIYSAVEDIDDVILQHIHIGPPGVPGTILVDLMGPDYLTNPASDSAEATITYTQAAFTRILANPAGFYVNLHTTLAPGGLVRGQLSTADRTIFASLAGAEVTPAPGPGSGSARIVFTGVHTCTYTITMTTPAASDITEAHIHDGPAGQNGVLLVDLFASGDDTVSGNTITGSAGVPGRTVARILGGTPGGSILAGSPPIASLFYIDLHTLANPGGTARGQIIQISGDVPPAGLAYSSPTASYQTGAAITPNTPSSNGGAITNYAVSPALPPGLSIHPTTGIISGTPTSARAATDYTVTASNVAGSTTAIVNITVTVGPPLTLSYSTPVGYIVGVQIANNNPVATGGPIATFSVSPALPGGINLNPVTGIISGTPNAITAAADYTVTGTNTAGSVQAVVNITVTSSVTAPTNLTYSSMTPSYTTGYAITNNTATVSGSTPMTFTVSPALPAGLTISSSTGTISGTPTTVTAAADYTVTATNGAGNTTAIVNITVTLGKPGPFTYSNDPNLGYAVPPFAIQNMVPTHVGGGPVSSYSISPALSSGLSISSTTGVISGTPTSVAGSVQYTITATNGGGTTQTTVTINVPY